MIPIFAISTGKIEDLNYGQKRQMLSALNKVPFSGKMWLSTLGFVEDEQAYKDHGGPHKAVCSFSKANYTMYKDDLTYLPEYAMFGENLTIEDLDESDVYFGNQYRLGDAIIEVSEIREPCWKIQTKFGIPDLVKRMSSSGKTGFYFRVIKEGFVKYNDDLELLHLADADTRLSVQELNDIYYNDRNNLERLNYALQNPYLSPLRIEKLKKLRDSTLKAHK
ncbi:MOSC domain-containing protein [Staphylococcus sp. NRL 16/872]|uniref:MOSC domain-containing protein n=1 Tax=Staphylococcus sp. NRL 16/872 TaxID=2930131 RepID=UPI001FB3847F|nr:MULTISPECIES: MOSC domain-containing protein [unclassified Staphylococcus]MCJ1655729.1 MOSC domain-containing protein [Staphylococcus sp. NRL 21/187]MCJ1661546.1 MOSC domain-containing protein [Staphylococcus sp. NRL 18/288]MCJ1667459.1 MOSC domain-containing protein [Staphylococcus sp. NRL 19/737]WEN69943.1 MOSC domain-containing protein [Staphylococcus sp. NRL 16/872]